MRFAITGEKGFIARNLARVIVQKGHEFVSLLDCPHLPNKRETGEPCVYGNGEHEWYQALHESGRGATMARVGASQRGMIVRCGQQRQQTITRAKMCITRVFARM